MSRYLPGKTVYWNRQTRSSSRMRSFEREARFLTKSMECDNSWVGRENPCVLVSRSWTQVCWWCHNNTF